jgi:ABC-type lipoprotein release transport system permease subunit
MRFDWKAVIMSWEAGHNGTLYGVIGAISGLLLGAIVGIFINTIWWLFSTFQEIRNYLKKIAERE